MKQKNLSRVCLFAVMAGFVFLSAGPGFSEENRSDGRIGESSVRPDTSGRLVERISPSVDSLFRRFSQEIRTTAMGVAVWESAWLFNSLDMETAGTVFHLFSVLPLGFGCYLMFKGKKSPESGTAKPSGA